MKISIVRARGRKSAVKKRVLLTGNPNAGKTALFNALTGENLRTGNFHGVTTASYSCARGGFIFVDSPGLYSHEAYSMEERGVAEEIAAADIVVNVIDSLTLENSLRLTRELLSCGKPVIAYLTKLAALKRRGGRADKGRLSEYLGVPVCTTVRELKGALEAGAPLPRAGRGELLKAYSGGRREISRADRLFYNRFFSLAFFVLAMLAMFFTAFYPKMIGALLRELVEELVCVKLPEAICAHMENEALISLLSEGVFGGAGGVLAFLPQLAVLYLFLTLLDESGVTSALAFCTDGLFEKVRLSGRAAFTLISGYGCTAAAISTARGSISEEAQRRTIAVLPYVPCGAKLPVFLAFLSPLFENPFPPVACLYFAGTALTLAFSRFLGGRGEDMLAEVAPIGFPSPVIVLKKLYFQLKGFIIKVTATVMLFCVVSWALSHYSFSFEYVPAEESMLAGISGVVRYLFYPMGITDWRLAYAALSGFIAKENVAATVGVLMPDGAHLALPQALSMCAFVLLSPACVSAFTVSCREAGLAFTLKCYAVQTAIAFLGAYLIYFLFSL